MKQSSVLQNFRFKNLIGTLLLPLLVLAGCAGPHRAVLPPANGEEKHLPEHLRVLRKGDLVKVVRNSAPPETGEVLEVSHGHIVLGRASNYGFISTSIPAEEIVSIQLEGGDKPRDAALAVFAVAIATAALFFISMGNWDLN
jgi:hypothetical protein